MNYIPNEDLCIEMGLRNGQMRDPYDLHNLYWSFEGSHVAFGYGDLITYDYERILSYLSHPSHEADIVFLGWNEHHGTRWEQTIYPMVRISVKDGITYPHRDAREQILKVVR